MRASTACTLVSLALAACAGEDLILGDGRQGPMQQEPSSASKPEFGPPRPISALASEDASDDDPSLTADLLVLCFNSERDGGQGEEDIWCTSRDARDDDWRAPELQTSLNSPDRETGIALSLDGLSLWFSSDRDGGAGGLDVYTTSRAARDASWSEPVRVPELSSPDDDLVSSIDESGRQLFMARRAFGNEDDTDSADDYDILLAQRPELGAAWQSPRAIEELNTDDEDTDAFLVTPSSTLIFSRGGDLFAARRTAEDATFSDAEPIESLNSDSDDRDPWANATLSYIVFSSDRDGSNRLYEAERAASRD